MRVLLINLFFISFYMLSLQVFAQNNSVDDVLNINLSKLDKNALNQTWIAPHNGDISEHSASISNNNTKLDDNISSIIFHLDGKAVTKVHVYFSHNSPGRGQVHNQYNNWLETNVKIYNKLLKKFGPPTDFKSLSASGTLVKWKKDGFFIALRGHTANNITSPGSCEFSIHLKDQKENGIESKYYSAKILNSFHEKIKRKLSSIIPRLKPNKNLILQRITLLYKRPHIPAKGKMEVRYYEVNQPRFTYHFSHPWNLMLVPTMKRLGFKKKPNKNGTYMYFVFENDLVRESGKLILDNGTETKREIVKVWYDQNRAPVMVSEDNFRIHWIDYNEKGLISRVSSFRDELLHESYICLAKGTYNERVLIQLNHSGKLVNSYIQVDSSRFSHHSGRSVLFKDTAFIQRYDREIYKTHKLLPPLPNVEENDPYKPKAPFNTNSMEPIFEDFKNFQKFLSKYNKAAGTYKIENKLNAEAVFKEKDFLAAHVEKISKEYFPLAVSRIGNGTVQLVDKQRRSGTFKVNSIVMNKYQVKSITRSGVELKEIKTGAVTKLPIGKALPLGVSALIDYMGRKHSVIDGTDFLGYTASIKKEGVVFSKNNKEYPVIGKWAALPPAKKPGNLHKVKDCTCYNGEDADTSQQQEGNEVANEKPFDAKDIAEAKSKKIDLKYLLKFCSFYVTQYKMHKLPDGTMQGGGEFRSKFMLTGSNLKQLDNSPLPFKVTFRNDLLFVDGKVIRKQRNDFKQEGYGVQIKANEYAILTFYPLNIWTFERMIENYSFRYYANGKHITYLFKEKVKRERINNQWVKTPFTYRVNPAKNEIIIDNVTYKYTFLNGRVTATNPKTGDTLQLDNENHYFPVF